MNALRRWITLCEAELKEAPIGNFDVDDMSPDMRHHSGSMRHDDDRKILSNPKAIAKIKRIFEKTPYIFDLYFVDRATIDATDIARHLNDHVGLVTRHSLQQKFGIILKEPSSPKAISVVFSNNEGANRMPMTAWTIAHRIMHIIGGNIPMDENEKMLSQFGALMNDFGDHSEAHGQRANRLQTAYLIGTMRSARERNLNGSIELLVESFAQYLTTGKVRFNRLPESDSKVSDGWIHPYSHQPEVRFNAEDVRWLNAQLGMNEKWFPDMFNQILAKLQGEVLFF